MEEGRVSRAYLPELCAWAVRVQYVTILINVPGVKKLIFSVTRFATCYHIAADIVEFAKAPGELYVGFII
jgi:hypothetical protein